MKKAVKRLVLSMFALLALLGFLHLNAAPEDVPPLDDAASYSVQTDGVA